MTEFSEHDRNLVNSIISLFREIKENEAKWRESVAVHQDTVDRQLEMIGHMIEDILDSINPDRN